MVGPIISGAMAEHTGVESFWWFNTGMLLFTLVVCIFLFPETRYHRAWETGDAPKPPPVRDPKAVVDKADGSLHEKQAALIKKKVWEHKSLKQKRNTVPPLVATLLLPRHTSTRVLVEVARGRNSSCPSSPTTAIYSASSGCRFTYTSTQ